MRRYSLGAVLGIATEEEDDDGNSASGIKTPTTRNEEVGHTEELGYCDLCGKQALISQKTGRQYCPDWKLHQEVGEEFTIQTKNIKEFFADAGEPDIKVETKGKKIKHLE
jgi:hypothetical protein